MSFFKKKYVKNVSVIEKICKMIKPVICNKNPNSNNFYVSMDGRMKNEKTGFYNFFLKIGKT